MSSTTLNSDVLDFVVHQANGVKGLVDKGLESLPHRYIQPQEERLNPGQLISNYSIPVIDISNWDDDPKVGKSVYEAAIKWGFFQIINHGIPLEVLDNIKKSAHEFFGLPNEERKKYRKGKSVSDTMFLGTSFSPLAEKVLEWKDYISFHYVPEDDKSPTSWPPVCKDSVIDYTKNVEPIIKKLLEVLLKGINVKEVDKIIESYGLMGSLAIIMNYYPHCPNPELAAGVSRHSDGSFITVLLQDEVGGLYVRGTEENTWIHVPPVQGALVINVGDVLQIMSNDKYKSIEHRAVANASRNRISIPIFVNPRLDALVGPLPQLLESGEPPLYKQFLYSDYFHYFFSKGHDGKNTMEMFKI